MELCFTVTLATWCNSTVNITQSKKTERYKLMFNCTDVLSCNEPSDEDISAEPLSAMARNLTELLRIARNAELAGYKVKKQLMLCACGDTQEECSKYCKVECIEQSSPRNYGLMKDYSGEIT